MTKTRVLIIERQTEIIGRLQGYFMARPDIDVIAADQNFSFFIEASYNETRAFMDTQKPDAVVVGLLEPSDDVVWISRLQEMTGAPFIALASCAQPSGVRFFDVIARPSLDCDMLPAFRMLVYAVRRSKKNIENANTDLKKPPAMGERHTEIIAVGASAGGTQAISEVFSGLPADLPPIVVVQHITRGFAELFARHLNDACLLTVSAARDGEAALPGHAYIAPDDMHLTVSMSSAGCTLTCRPGARISGHIPSVDALFASVARASGAGAVGVLLTGMGRDGAEGLLRMKMAGAHTICQDEATSSVYGMPRAAMELGAVDIQLPLSGIAREITRLACAEEI